MNEFDARVPRGTLSFRVVTQHADIPAFLELAREAHRESRFSYIPFSADKVAKIAGLALKDDKRHGIFIAARGYVPVGFAYCTLGEYHIGTDVLIATIHNINVSREERQRLAGGRAALGLLNRVKSWARARGASEILFHVTSGIKLERTHRLAKRLGYATIGGSYAFILNTRS
ncbi:GNAT family N-acetyltransferase [Paracoccus salsus]|uniref:GNAT family N-acetyltransferase n=1 Tax=Paracoccus salsus TaxID=2911061 RepID=UPI001F3E9F82|nr:GNAT family N-acetyltransferase [Paracoccus salsus]MCF3974142.1 GNAT family N-acetyltransferase [Paracoccus salsus]